MGRGRCDMLLEAGQRTHQAKRRDTQMKMRITVNIENDDNAEAVEPTTIELGIPNFDAFTGPDTFGEIFDRYERKALEARNDAMKAATEKYLSELAKKNTVGDRGRERENY
jgi:hypothetical protein